MDSTQPQASVLAVDDDTRSLMALQGLVSDMSLRLVTAKSGDEALHCVLRQDFAVILMDARMPGVDGFEAARLIRERERSRRTPIIFLTSAYEDAPSVTRGYEVGAVDYIVKPLIPEILKAKISVFVDLYRNNALLLQQIKERLIAAFNEAVLSMVSAAALPVATERPASSATRQRRGPFIARDAHAPVPHARSITAIAGWLVKAVATASRTSALRALMS